LKYYLNYFIFDGIGIGIEILFRYLFTTLVFL